MLKMFVHLKRIHMLLDNGCVSQWPLEVEDSEPFKLGLRWVKLENKQVTK